MEPATEPSDINANVEEASMKKSPKKIYIPIRIRTNALNNDDIAISATYISIEDLPNIRKRESRDIEIRYLDGIKSFRDKIKSSYSCNQDQCPIIKARLDHHQMSHHQSHQLGKDLDDQQVVSSSPNTLARCCSFQDRQTQSVAISTTPSILKKSPTRFTKNHSMQTSPKCVDFAHTTQKSLESNICNPQPTSMKEEKSITLGNHDAVTVTEISSFKNDLQGEIQKWFEDIPIYPNLTPSVKNIRINLMNEFIDRIHEISTDNNATDSESKIKIEVENFLNALPMWYPGAKRDQGLLKQGIQNNVLEKIKELRVKYNKRVNTTHVDNVVENQKLNCNESLHQLDSDDKEKIIESEVLDWLMQIKFKENNSIGKTINIIDATDIFTNRLLPLLDKPSGTKNYKLILKGLIVDTLNDLPNVLHYPKNKRIYLNKIAEDLTNRLITIKIKYKHCFNNCFPKARSTFLAVCGKSSLKQTLLDGLRGRLQKVCIDQLNVKEEITNMLIDCLESIRFKEDYKGRDELIRDVIGNSIKISETLTSDITDNILTGNIIENVKDTKKNKEKTCHSETVSVFASEHELFEKQTVTSTPKQKYLLESETQELSKEETGYITSICTLIRNWMATLPTTFEVEENTGYVEVMLNDLAGDITDERKIEQLAPKTNANRDQAIFYIILRWLFRFELYENLDDAKPQIDKLVRKINELPTPIFDLPHRGDTETAHNIIHNKQDKVTNTNLLQENILHWMNEQPRDIFSRNEKDYTNKMIQELAEIINKVSDKKQQEELNNKLSKWLKIMLKSSEKKNIARYAQSLEIRITDVFQDTNVTNENDKNSKNVQVVSTTSSDQNYVKSSDSKTSEDSKQSKGNNDKMKDSQDSKENKTTDSNISQNTKFILKTKGKNKKNVKRNKGKRVHISESETSLDSNSYKRSKKKATKKSSSQSTVCKCSKDVKQTKSTKNKKPVKDKETNKLSKSSNDGRWKNRKSSKTNQENEVLKEIPMQNTPSSEVNVNEPITSASDMSQTTILTNATNPKKEISLDPTNPNRIQIPDFNRNKYLKNSENTNNTKYRRNSIAKKASVKSITTCDPNCQINASNDDNTDNDKTLMELIGKYLEHNDTDNNITKEALEEILKVEIQKHLPHTRKEVYDYFTQKDESSPERLEKELQYIKDISDWLKNIPIDGSFNRPQNKERIEVVNILAKNICAIEDKRQNEPGAMDYNIELALIIRRFTEQLPILSDYTDNIILIVDQLVNKVVASRTPMPCCMNATATSLDSSGIPKQNISEFIENYIRINVREIADDPVKLEAWSARVLEEAKKIIQNSSDPSTLCKTDVYNNLADVSIPDEESVRLFDLELDYAKEISDWLNNLPLLPIITPEGRKQRVKMISDLAEKFEEREKNKIANSNQQQADSEIKKHITDWINAIPLDANRELVLPLVIQQLLNRIERVNRRPQEITFTQNDFNLSGVKPISSTTKFKRKVSKTSKHRPTSGAKAGQFVVDAIESWSNGLPIKIKCKTVEKSIKDTVARNLLQKVGDLSVDPEVMNDDLLFQDLLGDEVNQQLNLLPQNSDIMKKRETLKNNFVEKVMEAKTIAEESVAGEKYRQQLENTVEESIPNPIDNQQHQDVSFEIYKNRLTEMFILENFDHSEDETKLKYEKILKNEIDKYYQDVQRKNALSLTREQLYSELYGALFKVPVPGDSSTADEVEEVKTRCEITDWFQSLPLVDTSNDEDLLNRDQIQSMLAKRLREIEKTENKPDDKIIKEITKWLEKLPLQADDVRKVNDLASDLLNRLKSTKEDRKYYKKEVNDKSRSSSKTKGILGTSQVAGPSSAGHTWVSPSSFRQVCCQSPRTPRKKAANIILEIVQNWCDSLPFYENTQRNLEINKIIREELCTKIIIKICELNGDPKIFSDDLLYDCLLDDKLEKIMSNLPICCDFESTKDYKKSQLKDKIKSVKPLVKEERTRHEYKKELNETVNNVLKEPLDNTAEKMTLFNELREDIVDSFIQYHYNRDDDVGRQFYKAQLHDAVFKYCLEIQNQRGEKTVDPLIRQNQLLCELAKIPVPGDRSIQDEVEEIKMKHEVKQFLDELDLSEEKEERMVARNNIQQSLARRLNEIEKSGHDCNTDAKMKKEITRYLNKMERKVSDEKIESFVESLKTTEATRKAIPFRKDDMTVSDPCCFPPNDEIANSASHLPNNSFSNESAQSPRQSELQRRKLCCPQAYNDVKSLGVTPIEYQGFGGGVALSSSPRQSRNEPQNTTNVAPNQSQTERNTDPITHTEGSGKFETNKRRQTSNGERVEDCSCPGKSRRKIRTPRCVLRGSQFCEDCEEYGPMWMMMPHPRFPPGWYYY